MQISDDEKDMVYTKYCPKCDLPFETKFNFCKKVR